jgi:hypothetical protein
MAAAAMKKIYKGKKNPGNKIWTYGIHHQDTEMKDDVE